MNVYISVDIEGITGVVSWSAAGSASSDCYDWPFARRMMTHDVNAAIRGARRAGAERIVVKDSHGNCKNLLIDELEPDVELISGWNGGTKRYMMEGIEDGPFGCVILVGYHAMAGTRLGVMEHAMSGTLHRLWMNGEEVGEIALSAALAGEQGIPVALVTSDAAACEEVQHQLPGTQVYVVKSALSRFMARLKHPSVTGPEIEAAAQVAVEAAPRISPYRVGTPTTLRVQFKETHFADIAATALYASRIDGYTVEVAGETFGDAHERLGTVLSLGAQGRNLGS